VGNVIGLTELDVDNMELLSGASSALYGSGGLNGTVLITSKDPFKYQGVSFQVKQGIMHINDPRHSASPFYDWSVRWGKKVSDKFAFKFGAQYIKADDWEANDTSDLLRTNVISGIKTGPNTTRATDHNYDGVNVFGDEASSDMKSFSQAAVLLANLTHQAKMLLNGLLESPLPYSDIKAFLAGDPQTAPLLPILPFYAGAFGPQLGRADIYGNQAISRTGYYEKDVVDYNAYNLKFSAGLYYNIHANTELSLTGNWGMGTSVYTGADRYSLKNFTIGQYKLEARSKNWFLRAYTTQENSGDSYASTLTALAINNSWKNNPTWFAQYVGAYSDAALQGVDSNTAHAIARSYAETGRYLPGTQQFKDAFNKSVKTPVSEGGSQFKDKSSLYQFEGQLNLSPYIKVIDVLVGASYRWYDLNSNGTIFADTSGKIKINEYGTYVQLKKVLLKDVLTLTASGRYDKNENFEGRFTPRITASIKVAKDNNIRLSYQEAYRFPNNQDQWINLQTPGSILIGCLPGFATHYNFANNPVYTIESVLQYRGAGGVQANPANVALLKVAEFKKAKPETVHSFEIGYRGVIANKLLIDAYFYTSKYQDFIGRAAVARGDTSDPTVGLFLLTNPLTSTNFSFVVNSPTPVKANGWGIGAEYHANKGYRIMANIFSDDLHDVPPDLITFFNAPKYRFNIGLANANIYKGFGFNVIYKWQDKIFWEGTFAAGEIPSFGNVDAQVSYKLGKTNNLIKLGATNLFNNYYRSAFGNPYVGGLYYISFGYNVF
jgi:outer membrane receptor protein involved in Fe transport